MRWQICRLGYSEIMFYCQSKDKYWEGLWQIIIFRVSCFILTKINSASRKPSISPSILFLWSLHLCCASLCSVIMSSQFSVTDQAGMWRWRGSRDSLTAYEKAYVFCCWPLVSRWRNLKGFPPLSISLSIRLSIAPFIAQLPSSYAYLLIMLQSFPLKGIPSAEVAWQHSHVRFHANGLYHFKQSHMCDFSLGPCSWLDLSVFFLS